MVVVVVLVVLVVLVVVVVVVGSQSARMASLITAKGLEIRGETNNLRWRYLP